MIPRLFALRWPLTAPILIQLEQWLSTVARKAAQIRTDSYTGNGVAGKVLGLGMKADLIYIAPSTIGGSTPLTAAIGMRHAPNVTYVIGTGNVSGVVTEWTDTGVVIGSHEAVNKAAQGYHLLAVG